MVKTKKLKMALTQYDQAKLYPVSDGCQVLKKISFEKFDASADVSMHLGVDPRKSDQMVRGTVSLPHGLGKEVRVLVLCTPDKEEEAKKAGADHVGLEDYIEKLEKGWTDIDLIITMPTVMVKLGKLGKVLGPRGLMPNPKTGTVTLEVGKAVQEVKAGKINFKVDKAGNLHTSFGRMSFTEQQLEENLIALVQTIHKLKPTSAKGTYFKSITVSTTMGTGVKVDKSSIPGL